VSLELLLQQVLNGLMMGSVYVLMALGLVLIYGVMHVLNFAHGVLFMLGGYLCHFLLFHVTGNYLAATALAVLAVSAIGVVIEQGVFRRLRGNLRNQVVASLGLILLVQNLVSVLWGPVGLEFRVPASAMLIRLGDVAFSLQQFIVIAATAVVLLALHLFLTRTRLGTALRATNQSLEGALVVGIDVDRMYLGCFALGSGIAALGGSLLAPVFLLFPQMGDMPLMKGLAAIILGGMGSVAGAVVGGLFIGVAESLSTLVIRSDYRDAITFVAIVVVILLRPNGLFGFRVRGEA
jgi:branched-chain amino acid transport system permease protein